ncbi:hypothetical protein HG537_0B06120 [Torulaspora globosa]|uniref:STAS domain-containing protein n=1 Tax=Torulaspora globosa TaxID=48254 RepID=A0A7H9HNB1_9SACH|nr:hypothetical protein HG537_0B06120 [Torulaspora sp. CBS 2947]
MSSQADPLLGFERIQPQATFGSNYTAIKSIDRSNVRSPCGSGLIQRESVLSNGSRINSRRLDPNVIESRPSFRDVLPYYLPCFSWIPEYSLSKFWGDLIAGITLASFQMPLALSYATSLAHVEPLCGLYSLAFTPFVYAIFGSVPQMIVGPESAISLVVGQAVDNLCSHNPEIDKMGITVLISFISGTILFVFGICRFGFLGNVLSRALLRGFISSVGLVMIINSLITELKLHKVLEDADGHYDTPLQKISFILKYAPKNYHKPTAILSLVCFLVLITIRYVKKRLMTRKRWPVFVPEILILIITTIILSRNYKFKHKYNISVVGDFNTEGLNRVYNPFSKSNRELARNLLSESLVVAILGFFESTTASKSLGSSYDLQISSNRELVALGSMNMLSSFVGALPSFGGYGRSKINAFSGAQTVVSGACMGLIVLLTMKFSLSLIRYIPVCVLSVVTTIVGVSLLEEAPAELRFHIRSRGYNELMVFALTILATFIYSLEVGVCIGCGYSVINIIKHSAKSRIQILARIERTDQFINSDEYFSNAPTDQREALPDLEELEGCLVVKIPEPLTFTNMEDLKERLGRLERFKSAKVHPGTRGTRTKESIKYVVFDLHGMTFMDSSAAQIMLEIVIAYKRRCVRIFLARVPLDQAVRSRLEASGITDYVERVPFKGIAASIEQETNKTTRSSPYFATIQDTLQTIDDLQLLNPVISNDQESLLSTTLVNSNLV